MSRRRRGLLLAGLALVLGGLAASDVARREDALRASLGPEVEVVVARTAVRAGVRLAPAQLALRRVPGRYAPRGAFASPGAVLGARVARDLPAGADVTAAVLAAPSASAGPALRRGERVADVIALGPAKVIRAGGRVDVLVTWDAERATRGATEVALRDVEVLAAAPAPEGARDEEQGARVAASLRVTARQALYLADAQTYARAVRLLPRPVG